MKRILDWIRFPYSQRLRPKKKLGQLKNSQIEGTHSTQKTFNETANEIARPSANMTEIGCVHFSHRGPTASANFANPFLSDQQKYDLKLETRET